VEIVRRVVRQNEVLADVPGHRDSAERRIREGEVELERLDDEIRWLESEVDSARESEAGETRSR